ncbi:Hint domain-containing protein [Actibacterium sp. D379-3]
MSHPRLPAAGFAAGPRAALPALSTVTSDRQPSRATPLTRRYEVAGLTPVGRHVDFSTVAPATPDFESACASFARGTLIATLQGPVAIEDLIPGMDLLTADAGPQKLLWVGSMMVFPSLPGLNEDDVRLTRITADTFGLGRPMSDLMLGPRARLLFRHSGCVTMFGTPAAFAPARAFADGTSMISVKPATPVRVYHLALHGQHIIRANGIEVESFHPGDRADTMMDKATWDLFLGLFPHARSIADFGPMPHPRLTAFEYEGLNVA